MVRSKYHSTGVKVSFFIKASLLILYYTPAHLCCRKLIVYEEWCNLSIHIAMDNLIVLDDVLDSCAGSDKPLLLMVPLRLGITEINPIYIDTLKAMFEISGCVGMIGGRPNQALFFIGYVGDEALFLDPHTTQNTGSVGDKLDEEEIEMDNTYHQKYAMRINFQQIDPSLAIGFLARDRNDFDKLCDRFRRVFEAPGRHALFEISTKRFEPWEMHSSRGGSGVCQDAIAFDLDNVASCNSDDEFEIIV